MQLAATFLKRFKHLKAPERTVRSAVQQAAHELVDFELPQESIKVQGEVVYLNPPSALKAALFQQKKSLLTRINNILGKEQVKELR